MNIAKMGKKACIPVIVIIAFIIGSCEKDYFNKDDDSTFIDSRDNKSYKTVKIGDQVWLAENLAYLNNSYLNNGAWVYGYSGTDTIEAMTKSNYIVYGVLYDWATAISICPEGWHLPTDTEWEILAEYISVENGPFEKPEENWSEVGGFLKSVTGWNSNGSGSDDYEFGGLPAGQRNNQGLFNVLTKHGTFWSSSASSGNNGYYRYLSYINSTLYKDQTHKGYGNSVRCIKDYG